VKIFETPLQTIAAMYVMLSHEPVGSVELTLPMPPDFRTSFAGSAMPYPSEFEAFSPRQRTVLVEPGLRRLVRVPVTCRRPNWYYRDGVYGPPRVIVHYTTSTGATATEMREINDCPNVPWRTLTRSDKTPIRRDDPVVVTQEAQLYAKRWCANDHSQRRRSLDAHRMLRSE
jgi:hypothetical protein